MKSSGRLALRSKVAVAGLGGPGYGQLSPTWYEQAAEGCLGSMTLAAGFKVLLWHGR